MADIKNLTLRIDENGLLAEVEANDYYQAGPDPERDKHNEEFMEKEVKGVILNHFAHCACQMGKLQERAMRRAELLGIAPGSPIPMEIEQEDLDNYNFAACVISENGYMQRMSFYIRECKTCRRVEYYGDIHTLTDLFAEATTKQVSAEYMAEPVPEQLESPNDEVVDEIKESDASEDIPENYQSAEDILGPGMFIENLENETGSNDSPVELDSSNTSEN